MAEHNIEIQNAKQTIDLLKLYSTAKTQEEKDALLQEISLVNYGAHILLTKQNYNASDLVKKIEQAIQLDKYRPKNMSILQLAISDDLEHINGDFDTVDIKLSKMLKNNEEPTKIRDRFIRGTANIYMLAKQFSADWIRRLNNHKELSDSARNANEDTAVDSYNKLFTALTKDFCTEHNCHINSKVITDWSTADIKPKKGWNDTLGYQQTMPSLVLPKNISEQEKTKIIEEFSKNPNEYPDAKQTSYVRLNITNIRKKHHEPTDFFYTMISIFAHEMHHALDYQHPREGALGPQIKHIDDKTYTTPSEDINSYHASATEISSHEIQHELLNQLKNMHF